MLLYIRRETATKFTCFAVELLQAGVLLNSPPGPIHTPWLAQYYHAAFRLVHGNLSSRDVREVPCALSCAVRIKYRGYLHLCFNFVRQNPSFSFSRLKNREIL